MANRGAVAVEVLTPLAVAPGHAPVAARPRVLWLAVAEGRGHLMRAQLMRRLLGAVDVDVDLVTTSPAGAAFVAEHGARCAVLPPGFALEYDARQGLQRARTAAHTLSYLARPSRCRRDLRWIEARARGAALVVNDSFHPALVLAPLLGSPLRHRLVQVYGEEMLPAVLGHLGTPGLYASLIRTALDRSLACVEHSFGAAAAADAGTIRLPPVIAMPRRRAAEVRARLGVGADDRLAVVYLNPFFRDPELAATLERGLARAGYRLYGVAEGLAGRPGWQVRDPDLVDAIAAADLFVSAPGMASLAQARSLGVPYLGLATGQPEQSRNVAAARAAPDPRQQFVEVGAGFATQLAAAIAAITALGGQRPRLDVFPAAEPVNARWVDTFRTLIFHATRSEERR